MASIPPAYLTQFQDTLSLLRHLKDYFTVIHEAAYTAKRWHVTDHASWQKEQQKKVLHFRSPVLHRATHQHEQLFNFLKSHVHADIDLQAYNLRSTIDDKSFNERISLTNSANRFCLDLYFLSYEFLLALYPIIATKESAEHIHRFPKDLAGFYKTLLSFSNKMTMNTIIPIHGTEGYQKFLNHFDYNATW
ncbi:MAG: hypothetical protein ABIC95_04860 [archaeon]